MDIRDRIVDFRRVKASDLVPHPANWRTHPQTQREAVAGILSEVGYVDALICRTLPDGRLGLIDGHLRQDLTPDAEVPVLVVDLDEAEASKVLATFDPLGAMAEANSDALGKLLAEIQTDSEAVQAMLDGLAESSGVELLDEGVGGLPASDSSLTLAERFGVPPFSVLDARQGYWQDRKRAWLSLGIQSEVGRGGVGKTLGAQAVNEAADLNHGTYASRAATKATPGGQ